MRTAGRLKLLFQRFGSCQTQLLPSRSADGVFPNALQNPEKLFCIRHLGHIIAGFLRFSLHRRESHRETKHTVQVRSSLRGQQLLRVPRA